MLDGFSFNSAGAINNKTSVPIKIPTEADKIMDMLYKNNFEAYIVGGCIRDCLLNKTPKDWDITTNAKPEQIKNIFLGFAKVVDTGIAHGTVTVVLNKKKFEVTTYRIDGNYKDYRRPEKIFFTSSLAEDLSRRDFSMNAIAYSKKSGLVDIFNGVRDIKMGIIRCVGSPEKRFNEDALRMLRALRFACQLDFDIYPQTYCVLKKNIKLIKFISIERIRDELTKLFTTRNTNKIFLLDDSGVLEHVNSDFSRYFSQNFLGIKKNLSRLNLFLAKDYKDYDEHSACQYLNFDRKKLCYNKDSAVYYMTIILVLYRIKSDMALDLLKFFRFDNKTCAIITVVLRFLYKKVDHVAYELKRFMFRLGFENFFLLLQIKKIMGQKDIDEIVALSQKILYNSECVLTKDLLVSGNDIKSVGFSGKQIGVVLNYLLDVAHSCPEKNNYKKLILLATKLKNHV